MKAYETKKKLALSLAVAMVASSAPVLAFADTAIVAQAEAEMTVEEIIASVSAAINDPFLAAGLARIEAGEAAVATLPDGATKTALTETLQTARHMYDGLEQINQIWVALGAAGWQTNYGTEVAELEAIIAQLDAAFPGGSAFLDNFKTAVTETGLTYDAFEAMDVAAVNPTAANIAAAKEAVSKIMNPAAKANAELRIETEIENQGLAVVSVSAINATQFKVEFSENVDPATLISGPNIVANAIKVETAAGANVPVTAATLTGKTLILTVAATEGVHNVVVPYNTIKNIEGEFFAPSTTKVVRDTTAPTLTTAVASFAAPATKATSLVLTFDEEIASIQTVKIGTKVYTPVINGKTATITDTLGFTVPAAVTVVNVKDAAGNTTATDSVNYTINNDVTPPVLAGTPVALVANTENKITVKFSEKLAQKPTITATVGTFSTNIVTDVVLDTTDLTGVTYVVTLNPAYLAAQAGATPNVTVTVAKETAIDLAGLKNAADLVAAPVALALDKTAPGLTPSLVAGNLVLTYDEVVTLEKGLADISVTKPNGEIVIGTEVFSTIILDQTSKVVTLTPKEGIDAGTYTTALPKGLVKDKSVSTNQSAAVAANTTLVVTPSTTPFTIESVTSANNEITVNFGKKVNAATALDITLYEIDGSALTAGTATVEYAKIGTNVDQTRVIIKLKDGQFATTDNASIFVIAAGTITALDGTTNNALTDTVQVIDNVQPTYSSAVATDLDKLTVTFDEKVKVTGTITDEVKLFDTNGDAIVITAAAIVDGKLVLTVADATLVTNLEILEVTSPNLVDEAGNGVNARANAAL